MRVAAIQSDLLWESPEANRKAFSKTIETFNDSTDLLLLPEMFTTGFSMLTDKLAEEFPGETVRWMRELAISRGCAIAGSHIARQNGCFYNRFVFAFPDGKVTTYDKRHLFRMAGEDGYYTPGTERVILEYKGWRILPLVCYDLRFPVWSRNRNDYDLMIIVANFPERRSYAWNSLLVARAIENQCYVAACNRVGRDGNGVDYSGDSQIIDPWGEIMVRAEKNSEQIVSATLSLEHLQKCRASFPAHLDSDLFEIK